MYLCLDGGATKTHLLFVNEKFAKIKESKIGPLNFSVISPEKAVLSITQVLKSINTSDIIKAVFGIAGIDTLEEKLKAQELFQNHFNFPIDIYNDAELALFSATDKNDAVVLIAGTGSQCFGKNNQGLQAKTSGLDYLLADEGSSYAIGSTILKSAVRSFDGRGQKTVLEKLVLDYFQVKSIYGLKNHVYQKDFNKSKIADLSKLLDMALSQDDYVAKLILENNIGELLISLRPVVYKLNLALKDFDLVLAGSLFSHHIISFEDFSTKVKREFPRANLIIPKLPPVWGGIKLLS